MPGPRRLPVVLQREHAMSVTRVSIGDQKLVYVALADKKLNYSNGRSLIAYIGTTKRGISRIASSVAARAESILGLHGVRRFDVRVVTCRTRQKVKSWCKLERALLLSFRLRYGEVPRCNTQGNRMKETDEFAYFARSRIARIVEDLS
ncbi:MAG: hypothetical protein A49_07370 [Methyloceanibacter sp.]|nr:MAG: hypothetical protein A49_07370 [Methyloceanibacter sp.]